VVLVGDVIKTYLQKSHEKFNLCKHIVDTICLMDWYRGSSIILGNR